jgi:hypothetical protein
MEYTPVEKQVLTLMERTDFKNLSKSDLISYASKLNELRPEVAVQALAQFPELARLIQSSMVEYKGILDSIIASDDESTKSVYGIIDGELKNAEMSRKEFIDFADKVRSDLSKCLENPDMSSEQKKEIRDQEMEILRMVNEKDSEIRNQEKEMAQLADKKDAEKKAFNWRTIGTASLVVLTAVGIGASVLGGDFKFRLPKKN